MELALTIIGTFLFLIGTAMFIHRHATLHINHNESELPERKIPLIERNNTPFIPWEANWPERVKSSSSFNQDISSWDVSNVTSFKDIFSNCKSFDL